jgi:hypothetical protein
VSGGRTPLRKRDVERLLSSYDDDPTGALTQALARVLGLEGSTWEEVVRAADLPPARQRALLAGDQDALDDLARELNENRTI